MTTLTVSFDGLCLLAQDLQGVTTPNGDPRVYVLLVDGKPMATHLARLYFDLAYLDPTSTEESGVPFSVSLEDTTLTLGQGSNSKITSFFQGELLNLCDPQLAGTEPLSYSKVDPLSKDCTARLTLTAGGPMPSGPTTPWDIYDSDLPRASLIKSGLSLVDSPRWQIDLPPGKLVLHFMERDGITSKKYPGPNGDLTLFPINGGIRLHVFNSPDDALPGCELPPPPQPNDHVEHFQAFFKLFAKGKHIDLRVPSPPFGPFINKSGHTTRCTTAGGDVTVP